MSVRFFSKAILGLLLFSLFSSCNSYKKVPYFQVDEEQNVMRLESNFNEYAVRFKPDDVLSIVVNVVGEQSIAYDYNLPLQPSATTDNSSEDNVTQGVGRQTYMLNKDGYIDFPVLGLLKVAGYTQSELEQYLKEELSTYLKVKPVVTVRLMNFKITVTGEVNKPGEYAVGRDHVNVLQALALAGDMSIHGKRDNVKLIREMPDGSLKRVVLDVSQADVVSSPYFYLQQNDMLVVTPTKAKARTADISTQTNIIISTASILLSIASLIVLITR